jgi:probable HAF family extracellular repeat protein
MQPITRTILAAVCAAALFGTAAAAEAPPHHDAQRYTITIMTSLGGTNSRANSLDDLGIVGGYSKVAGNAVRHATMWSLRAPQTPIDLSSLGGAGFNSSIAWPVKNNVGLISGISETGAVNPLGETWSCGFFFATSGNVCYGFVTSAFDPQHRLYALKPLQGGINSYATGTNDWGTTVGWAENGVHDTTCASDSDQVLQFRPVTWSLGQHRPRRQLPLISGDTSGAATAINDRDQIVGISGTCDQAVGRKTATHAVLWENGHVSDLGNLGGNAWNTPTAINEAGDVVGFSGTDPADADGNFTHAFLKRRNHAIQDLGVLPGDISSTATSINLFGQVVGYSNDAAGHIRAVVWQNGMPIDLGSLAPGFDGSLVLANDVNDFGVIVGRGLDASGAIVAFVATPAH